jgi:peptidyl-prolyl cis-trans isomerase SurA
MTGGRCRGIAAIAIWFGLAGVGFAQHVFERVVVKVNGDILTRQEIDERVRSVIAQEEGRGVTLTDVRAEPALQQKASALVPRVVGEAIDELLVVQRARELGFGAADDDVDRVIARMRLDNDIKSDAEFADLLRSQGIPQDALRNSIRNQILIEQVRQDVFRRVSVTDPEARAYYRQHMTVAAAPMVVFRELLVQLPPLEDTRASAAVARDYDRGLIRFVKAQDRINTGEDFAQVATEASDAPSKNAGGLIGPVAPESLPGPMREALAKLPVGRVSAPVRTADGYRLLKLESVVAPRPSTFESARDAIVSEMLAVKQSAAFVALVKRLRAEALIDWKDAALKTAYDALGAR